MILILTEDDDRAVDQVELLLVQRGAQFLRFNNSRFPANAQLSIKLSNDDKSSCCFVVDGARYHLNGVSAVWERRPDVPAVPAQITRSMAREFVRHECAHFIEDVWQTLDCKWLPAPAATVRRVDDKILQTKVAHALGFDLPPAVITNDPAEFLEFYRANNGRIISKVFCCKLLQREAPDEQHAYRVFTEVVSNRAIGYASSIRYSPVIFQAYVPKRSELRVTVVGHKVFAAEILSQKTHRTRHDWRRYDLNHTPYLPHRLPEDLERRCIALLERLGLNFGAIDLVLTPDGRYVFLEVNPRGEWQWIEEFTGMPIAQAICDFLMEPRTAAVGVSHDTAH